MSYGTFRFRYCTRYFTDSGLLVVKSLFQAITSGLRICLCPIGRRFQSRWRVWIGYIRWSDWLRERGVGSNYSFVWPRLNRLCISLGGQDLQDWSAKLKADFPQGFIISGSGISRIDHYKRGYPAIFLSRVVKKTSFVCPNYYNAVALFSSDCFLENGPS